MPATARRQFLNEYGTVRASEGRGAEDARWYYELPWRDLSGRLAAQWAIRGRSWRYFESRLLPRLERQVGRPLRILDLGAGNCWMSWRLASRGHAPVAMDIFTDPRDGLKAARHYTRLTPFTVIEAEFDALPIGSSCADVAIFNASFHYSADYNRTLAEVRRVLRPDGTVVIMDSPIYKSPEHGRRMVEERKAAYQRQYGFASDALGSVEYLDEAMLHQLAATFRLRWTVHKPWYGLRWQLRPFRAWLKGKRPPSRFWILSGEFYA